MSNNIKQKIKEGLLVAGAACGAALVWVWRTAEKKGADEQRNVDSYETINILREAGHDDEEIIQILQKKWDLTRSEIKILLEDSSYYDRKEKE